MGGQVLFQDALAARLNLIRPSAIDVSNFLQEYPLILTKGVKKVIGNLSRLLNMKLVLQLIVLHDISFQICSMKRGNMFI